MQYLFGADTVSLYTFYLTDNTEKLLKFYQTDKKLEVIPLSLPSGNPTDPTDRSQFFKTDRPQKRRHELIPYNDCFYRHIYTHRYVLIIDIDEVIVPVRFDNYSKTVFEKFEKSDFSADLLRNFEKNGQRLSSISSRNVFKFQSNFTIIPSYQYMISNRKRSKKTNPNGEYGKSFSRYEMNRLFSRLRKIFHGMCSTAKVILTLLSIWKNLFEIDKKMCLSVINQVKICWVTILTDSILRRFFSGLKKFFHELCLIAIQILTSSSIWKNLFQSDKKSFYQLSIKSKLVKWQFWPIQFFGKFFQCFKNFLIGFAQLQN